MRNLPPPKLFQFHGDALTGQHYMDAALAEPLAFDGDGSHGLAQVTVPAYPFTPKWKVNVCKDRESGSDSRI